MRMFICDHTDGERKNSVVVLIGRLQRLKVPLRCGGSREEVEAVQQKAERQRFMKVVSELGEVGHWRQHEGLIAH